MVIETGRLLIPPQQNQTLRLYLFINGLTLNISLKKLNEIEGDGEFVNGLKISVGEENQHIDTDFVFHYLGTKNNSEFFGEFADLSENGFIITNERMETRTKNMYAIGDIREKEVRQVTTATNDGTIAATVIV